MLPNLQIPHWDTPQSNGGGAPSPLSLNAEDHVFSTDHFRMFQFKVRTCPRVRAHDWTECPYAHPAEKARRRDPRKYHYSGAPCPEFRKGHCPRGDSCEFAHGVFECWLHPSRYRTQLCKDGGRCRRRVCFFAHAAEQLRVLSPDSSSSSPTSVLSNKYYSMMRCESPPGVVPYNEVGQVRELVSSMRSVQIDEAGWPGFMRLGGEEMVESGREIRARMYAKLRRENSSISAAATVPDIGWISELVK